MCSERRELEAAVAVSAANLEYAKPIEPRGVWQAEAAPETSHLRLPGVRNVHVFPPLLSHANARHSKAASPGLREIRNLATTSAPITTTAVVLPNGDSLHGDSRLFLSHAISPDPQTHG